MGPKVYEKALKHYQFREMCEEWEEGTELFNLLEMNVVDMEKKGYVSMVWQRMHPAYGVVD